MLEFLKESTFRANDVFFRALGILRKHYFSVAGLCFLLFVTNSLSTYLALYLSDMLGAEIKFVLFLVFVILFFGLQLVLIKRAILLSKNIEKAELKSYIPTTNQFVQFILGLLLYSLITGVVYLLCSIIGMPLLYLGVEMDKIIYEINPLLTGLIMMFVLIRISFFPFFILENNFNIIRSVKMSIAFTKGNTINLLILMVIIASAYLGQLFFEYVGYIVIAKILGAINTFVIIPSVSLVLAVAYVGMIKEYKGSDDPELLNNIL